MTSSQLPLTPSGVASNVLDIFLVLEPHTPGVFFLPDACLLPVSPPLGPMQMSPQWNPPELPQESSTLHFLLALIALSYFTCCVLTHLLPIFKLVSLQLVCHHAYGAVCLVYRLPLVPRTVPGT